VFTTKVGAWSVPGCRVAGYCRVLPGTSGLPGRCRVGTGYRVRLLLGCRLPGPGLNERALTCLCCRRAPHRGTTVWSPLGARAYGAQSRLRASSPRWQKRAVEAYMCGELRPSGHGADRRPQSGPAQPRTGTALEHWRGVAWICVASATFCYLGSSRSSRSPPGC